MNKVRSIRIAAALLASVMLLSSCTPIGKMQQNGWIKKLSDAFPEDTFTFDGHPEQVLTGTDYSVVKVRSELYPDFYISLWKEKESFTPIILPLHMRKISMTNCTVF